MGPRDGIAGPNREEVRRPGLSALGAWPVLVAAVWQEAAPDLRKLGQDGSKFSPEDRLRLYRELATYLWEAGGIEQAKELAAQACQAARTNLAVRLLLFELTYLSQDVSGMEKVLAEIRSFQSEGALWHYGQALRLAVLAEHEPQAEKQASQFKQTMEHLSAARKQRPGWARARASDGTIV